MRITRFIRSQRTTIISNLRHVVPILGCRAITSSSVKIWKPMGNDVLIPLSFSFWTHHLECNRKRAIRYQYTFSCNSFLVLFCFNNVDYNMKPVIKTIMHLCQIGSTQEHWIYVCKSIGIDVSLSNFKMLEFAIESKTIHLHLLFVLPWSVSRLNQFPSDHWR